MKQGVIRHSNISSPLVSQKTIGQPSFKSKRHVMATLVLTSLVDAFSILVIYLIVQSGPSQEQLKLDNKIRLPMATQSEILDAGLSVKVMDGSFYINGESVSRRELSNRLIDLKESLTMSNKKGQNQLILQADRGAQFRELNMVIVASAEAGIEKVKFAVLPKESFE